MSAATAAKPMDLPLMDMEIHSVSDIKRSYSLIINGMKTKKTPVFVMNRNTPEAVLMTYPFYKEVIVDLRNSIRSLLKEIENMEDTALYAQAESRLKSENLEWLTYDEFTQGHEKTEDNPYEQLSDEELFD